MSEGPSIFGLLCILAAVGVIYMLGRSDGFKKKSEMAPQLKAAADQLVATVAMLKGQQSAASDAAAFDPPVAIGDRFTYLGREMLCSEHTFRHPIFGPLQGIGCEYVDNDGVLRGHFIHGQAVQALRAELGRAATEP